MSNIYMHIDGDLLFQASFIPDKKAFMVRVSYSQEVFINNLILDYQRALHPFSYSPPQGGDYKAVGELIYSVDTSVDGIHLYVELSEPVQTRFLLCTDTTWSGVHDSFTHDHFFTYDTESSASPELKAFYNALVALRQEGNRIAMENLAIHFIEGKPDYQGQFVTGIDSLDTVIKFYPAIYNSLISQPDVGLEILTERIEEITGLSWLEMWVRLQPLAYQDEKVRVWESFFALTISYGYNVHLHEDLLRALVIANLI